MMMYLLVVLTEKKFFFLCLFTLLHVLEENTTVEANLSYSLEFLSHPLSNTSNTASHSCLLNLNRMIPVFLLDGSNTLTFFLIALLTL